MRIPILFAALVACNAQAENWLYLTAPGDTLSEIGQTYLKSTRDWPKVQAVNDVKIPEHLPVNTRIKIPVELLKVTPAPVTVTAVTGNVRYKSGDGPFQRLEAGVKLNGGESVLSGPRSSASYRLADGGVLNQQESSKLAFGRLAAYGKTGMVSTELSLSGGRLEAHAAKQLAPAGGFRVITPVAVAGLRGTDFRLNVSDDGKFLRNEVLEGAVAVAAQGQEVRVEGGFGTLAEAGKPPEPPRVLLPAPVADGIPVMVENLPLAFAWQPLAGARAYRAQVAANADFSEILLDDTSAEPAITWKDNLPDGNYVLRLRGIDGAGLEGANRDHAFELDARPLPPAALTPTQGERQYQAEVEFRWAAAAEAQRYVFQLAPTPEFDSGLIERRLDAVNQHVETLEEGDWHWRLASVDAAGKQHSWGPHRAFRILFLPNPPAAQASAQAGLAHFVWGETRGAVRYGLQLGTTADLATPLRQEETAAASLAVPVPAGKYFWRVRGIESDGQAGAWGAVSPVIVPPDPPTDVEVKVDDDQVLATWKTDAVLGVVEVSTDLTFAKTGLLQKVNASRAILPRPDPGKYWLRVKGIDAHGVEGPYSRPVPFEIAGPSPWWLLLPLMLVP